ncbi:ankyrin repeat-containing domain protein [Aspergillus keveii]|uniref:Ankyrin repeat-containing domain protein n=1 Tax=Aspergillus keveii TaxID=714993 RepID=A0ABR4FQQ6_9EURO
MDNHQINLSDLPPELILHIGSYLWLKDLSSLVQTAKYFNSLLDSRLYAVGAKHVGPSTSPLILAIQHGPITAVDKLLEKGADPSRFAGDTNAFIAAVKDYKPRALKRLLAPSVSTSVPVTEFKSLLQMAVIPYRLTLLNYLLDAAPGYYPDDDGAWIEALQYAIFEYRYRAAAVLLEAAKKMIPSPAQKIDTDTIYTVVYRGDCDGVRLLLAFGWDQSASIGVTSPLHLAAEAGRIDLVKLLLRSGADPNNRDRQRSPPLLWATAGQHAKVVELLLKAGADPNAANSFGNTPLHECARRDSLRILDTLLGAGARPDITDDIGVAPLHTAISHGVPAEMIESLLQAGAPVNGLDPHLRTPLFLAAQKGDARTVEALLAAGADIKLDMEQGSMSPLHAAAVAGRAELMHCGAEFNHGGKLLPSAVFGAVSKGRLGALKVLLDAGADLSALNQDGSSILHDACRHGASAELVQLLIDHEADPRVVAYDHRTTLHQVVPNHGWSPIPTLLNAGIPIEARDNKGDTALLIAARRSFQGTRALLECGADPNTRGADGTTPLHHCSSHRDPETYTLLINAGADIASKDASRQTPLHRAAAAGNGTICERLLNAYIAKGLDYTERDAMGRTVLELAAISGSCQIMDKLLARGVDIDIGLQTDHGKHRGIPALHYAIFNAQPRAVAYLARHGAEYFDLDVYGRTAVDWASIDGDGSTTLPLSRDDRHNREVVSAPKMHPDTQTLVLQYSIVGIATRILEGDRSELYTLGKCLQYLGDLAAAGTIFAETQKECNRCSSTIPEQGIRYICTECPNIDLCASCIRVYESENMRIKICRGHKFWGVKVLDHRLSQRIPEGKEKEKEVEMVRAKWLMDLIDIYRRKALDACEEILNTS